MQSHIAYEQMIQLALAQQAQTRMIDLPMSAGAIHPAFVHTPYMQAPISYRPVHSPGPVSHARPSPPLSPKARAFSIDALLNQRNQDVALALRQQHPEMPHHLKDVAANMTNPLTHHHSLKHQHESLRLASHPYIHHNIGQTMIHRHGIPMQFKDKFAMKKYEQCCGKQKRVRTIFTPDQLDRLEKEFERQQYMVGSERYYLAASLNLSESQVKVWFQNRRIKWRKTNLERSHAKLAELSSEDSASDFEDDEFDGESDHDSESSV